MCFYTIRPLAVLTLSKSRNWHLHIVNSERLWNETSILPLLRLASQHRHAPPHHRAKLFSEENYTNHIKIVITFPNNKRKTKHSTTVYKKTEFKVKDHQQKLCFFMKQVFQRHKQAFAHKIIHTEYFCSNSIYAFSCDLQILPRCVCLNMQHICGWRVSQSMVSLVLAFGS